MKWNAHPSIVHVLMAGALAVCCLGQYGCASLQARLDKMNFVAVDKAYTSEPQIRAAAVKLEQKRDDQGAWHLSMSVLPGTAAAPASGSVFVLLDIRLENLPGRAVVISSNDLTLRDDTGKVASCRFWDGSSWAGTTLKASRSKLEVIGEAMPVAMPVPEEAHRETGLMSFIPAGPVELTKTLTGDTIRVLFEVPEERTAHLQLLFQERFVADVPAR